MGGCNVDADCSMGNWCNETAHMCMPQLANGMPVPTDGAHTNPTLNGTCSMAAGMLTCKSGVCDTKDNECGYANGDGPCTGADGTVVCRSGICATMGPNMGTCVACVMDSQCMMPTPACDTTSNTCVQCTTSAQCMMPTPVCSMGKCIAGCNTDADCMMGTWCNETAHMCVPTVPNGMPVPSDSAHTNPTLDGTCTPAAGKLTCTSGVCDPKDNNCGLANGDGPCANNAQCRNMMCDPKAMVCGPHCQTDADCNMMPDTNEPQFCASDGTCKPKLPDGEMCTANNQCLNGDCAGSVCSSVIGSGNGLICAARSAGPSGGGGAGLLGLALAAAGLARRRRKMA
jgi:MYXO-CTERM domain-containing protein